MSERQCRFGLTDDELRERLGERYDEFTRWMRGQTQAICDGRRYNYETEQYESSGCGPHGVATYEYDVTRFEQGLPIID